MSHQEGNSDIAIEQTMIFNELNVQAVRALLPTGPSAKVCGDCQDPIPEARRVALTGCQYCVDCAPYHEQKPRKVSMGNYTL